MNSATKRFSRSSSVKSFTRALSRSRDRTKTLIPLLMAWALAACSPAASDSGTGGNGGTSSGGTGGSRSGGSPGGSGSGGGAGSTGGSGGSGSGGSSGSGASAGSTGGSGTGGDTGGGGGTSGASGGMAGGTSDASAGTGGSSGTPDAASADAPPASSGDSCAGTKFCEDWEKQTAGQEPKGMFTVQKGGYATVTVDTAQHYSGKQSLHFHMANSPDDALMHLNFSGAPLFPFANNDIFGRVMLYLTRNPSRHWDLTTAYAAATVNDESEGEQFSLSGSSPDNHVMSVHQPGDKSVDSSDLWQLNKWVCVQWEFAADSAGGMSRIQIKFDGKFIDKGMNAAAANWKPGGFKSMFFGWKNFEGGITGNIDYWADDLAFGEKEIPCPAAM
jgi:hypothetical protein